MEGFANEERVHHAGLQWNPTAHSLEKQAELVCRKDTGASTNYAAGNTEIAALSDDGSVEPDSASLLLN